jgi:hypothetical protein
MKNAALFALLIPLTLFEIYASGAFLPRSWERAIDSGVWAILPNSHDRAPVTHPLLSQEIEEVLRDHIWLRIVGDAITIAVIVGNAWLIYSVWRLLRRSQGTPES